MYFVMVMAVMVLFVLCTTILLLSFSLNTTTIAG